MKVEKKEAHHGDYLNWVIPSFIKKWIEFVKTNKETSRCLR